MPEYVALPCPLVAQRAKSEADADTQFTFFDSSYHKRTATAVREDDMVLYSIKSDDVLKLYYQDPEFAFKTIQLILTRVLTGTQQPDRL